MAECAFCEKTKSNLYTCPKCNLNYCTVQCYQSQKHTQCSEQFYRNCVEDEVRLSENLGSDFDSLGSKKKTLAALKRLKEEEENDQEIMNEVLDSDDEEDVNSRFDGIDLDDTKKIWENLLDSEKQEFQKMLETGEIEKFIPKYIPWWEQNFDESNALIENIGEESNELKTEVYIKNLKEKIPNVNIEKATKLSILLGSTKPSKNIKFNLINVLYAYTYSVRYLRGEHHKYIDSFVEMFFLISGNLRDNQTFESADIAIQSAILNINQHSMISSSQEFTKTCKYDVMKIIKGPNDINNCNSVNRNIFLLAAISDVKNLFSFCCQKNRRDGKTEVLKCDNERKESTKLPLWLLDDGLFSENRKVNHNKSLLKKSIKKLDFYISWILECYSDFVISDG